MSINTKSCAVDIYFKIKHMKHFAVALQVYGSVTWITVIYCIVFNTIESLIILLYSLLPNFVVVSIFQIK